MESLLFDFSATQMILTLLLFVWAGFARSGLGFGGAALGLPLMLFIYDQPIFWLPVIGAHLLFFSALTLRTRLHNVDYEWLMIDASHIKVDPSLHSPHAAGARGGNQAMSLTKGGSIPSYLWPWMRMVCRSEPLLRKVPQQIVRRLHN